MNEILLGYHTIARMVLACMTLYSLFINQSFLNINELALRGPVSQKQNKTKTKTKTKNKKESKNKNKNKENKNKTKEKKQQQQQQQQPQNF